MEKVERGVRKFRTCLRKNAVRLAGDICRGMAERENVWGKEKTEDMAESAVLTFVLLYLQGTGGQALRTGR